MNKEYAIYPFRYMNITQRHDQGNHLPHWQNSTNYSDKPWDEACQDGGRSYFEPQNDFIVEQVLGLDGDLTTNSVRLKSVNKLYIPYKNEPVYLYLTLTHMNEDNLKQVYRGQILKKGTKILMEGTDGYATGNHFHITANIGNYYGLLQNSNGSWCFTYEKSLLPNEAFYLDSSYTNVIYAREYPFQMLPKSEEVGEPVSRNKEVDQIEVIIPELYCRSEAGLNGKILGFAKQGIYNYTKKETKDGYDWYYIGVGYIAYNNSWCNLYPKNEPVEPPKTDDNEQKKDDSPVTPAEPETSENEGCTCEKDDTLSIIKQIIELIKKLFSKIFNR